MKLPATINSVVVNVHDIMKIQKREGVMFEPMLDEVMKYILQGETDASSIVDEMKADGFETLVKPCTCIGFQTGCSSCEHQMLQETIVYNFACDILKGIRMGDGLRQEISSLSMRTGIYDVDIKVIDPATIEICASRPVNESYTSFKGY